jgi:hypothetical protein
MNSIVLSQIKILEDQIKNLPKGLTSTKRRKIICQWTFQKRTEDSSFAYWAVLNSGPAGETLCMSPIKTQKELYILRENVSITCDFKVDKTVLSVVDISVSPFDRQYLNEINY